MNPHRRLSLTLAFLGVALTGISLWRELPRPPQASPPLPQGLKSTASGPLRRVLGWKIPLNTAGERDLMALPGIGAGLARRILSYRQAHGGFSRLEELMEVPGIGPATLENIQPLLTLKEPAIK